MRLGYSATLRSNYLVVESKAEERNVVWLLHLAHIHKCEGRGKPPSRRKVAIAYANSDGSASPPKLVAERTLRERARRAGTEAA